MKKKVAILGSTGSIGKSLLSIIAKDKKNFQILLLTANKNYKLLLKQAELYNVRNIIINEKKYFDKAKFINKNKRINILNNFNNLKKIFSKKVDYTMSSISGLGGLEPTVKIIKYTKKIAIANKESIICGWDLIKKELNKNKTEFVPVDSEHFSIWYGLKRNNTPIDMIYLTASGGPFLNLPISKLKNVKVKDALKHPNWIMGKKITIDSATMMNKVFEIIEAKKIFNLNYKQLSILVQPDSYIHAIIKYKNGLIKLLAHSTDMKIPIMNTLYTKKIPFLNLKSKLEISKLNNLMLSKINLKKFPLVELINKLPKKNSLFETIIVSANDEFVNQFLQKKIKFLDINYKMNKILNMREFSKYKNIFAKKTDDILKLSNYVRFKIISKSI